uniref:RING-type domain-containing protein n=1 Tax=viral metagenome TaxID=1070528 RepID=A0A6C0F811_9ZZZZ
MFDFVEDQAKENYFEYYQPRNLPSYRIFKNDWFLKFIKKSLKFELNDAFTGISHWKRSFPLFKNNVDTSGLTLSWMDHPDDLHYINDFFRLTTEYQDYKNYRSVPKYIKMFYHLALFVARKRLIRDYPYVNRTESNERNDTLNVASTANTRDTNERNDTVNTPSQAIVAPTQPSPETQSIASIHIPGVALNFNDMEGNRVFIHDQTGVREVQLAVPRQNNTVDLTTQLPTPPTMAVNTDNPPPAPTRRPGRPPRRRGVRQPARSQPERRSRRRELTEEEELMRRLAIEDPHIERRRIMKSKLTYCMEVPQTVYQNESDGCPVCGEDMKSGNMFAIQCGHPFCGDCLGNVINKSAPSCPCCREDIQTIKFRQGLAPEPFNELMKAIAST